LDASTIFSYITSAYSVMDLEKEKHTCILHWLEKIYKF